jgi:hypothetical protein
MIYPRATIRTATRKGESSSKRRFMLVAVCSAVAAFALAGIPLAAAAHSLVKDMAASSGAPSAPCGDRPGICPPPQ